MSSHSSSRTTHCESLENRRLMSIVGFPGAAGDVRLVGAVDFSVDGQDDLVSINDSTGVITLQEVSNASNTPPTLSGGSTIGTATGNLRLIGVGAMKSGAYDSTRPDLIFYDTGLRMFGWWTTNAGIADGGWGWVGSGSAIGSTTLDADWTYWGNGDVNKDNYADLLFRRNSDGKLGVWYLNAGEVIGTDYLGDAADSNWRVVSVFDPEDNHANDLLWQNASTGQLVAWELDSSTHHSTGSYFDYGLTGATNKQAFSTGSFDGTVYHNDILILNIDNGHLDAQVLNDSGAPGVVKAIN